MRGLAQPNDGRRKKATRMAAAKGDKFLTRQVKKNAPYLIVNLNSASATLSSPTLPETGPPLYVVMTSEPREVRSSHLLRKGNTFISQLF